MSGIEAREIQLARRPEGRPAITDFAVASSIAAAPAPGEVRVRNLWMSVDPYMINRLYEGDSYVAPYRVGRPLDGGAIGVVVDSGDTAFAPGDLVSSFYGWREVFTAPAQRLVRLPEGALPPQAHLGIGGVTGMTAYVGLFEIGRLQPGETLYVSAAAGAVGTAACQMAKIIGARVIGSAGGADKKRFLIDLGVDHAIDYRAEDLGRALAAAAPEGIDLYFDNVGGPQLQAAFDNMKNFGRVAVCGMISQYGGSDAASPRNMFQIVAKRLAIRGFLLGDHEDVRPAFQRDIGEWIASGRLQAQETVVDGIEQAPAALLALLEGRNLGKMLVRLSG